MGEEIKAIHFRHQDFERFKKNLERETLELESWEREAALSEKHGVAGLELEMWIVDEAGFPLPINQTLIEQAQHPDIVKELSQFNVEFNVDPQLIEGRGLERLEGELRENWTACEQAARRLDAHVIAIGTLPTITEEQLSLRYISQGGRYRALNEQVMRLRHGRPFELKIEGHESLHTRHHDVMLEAGTTSFQIHFQVAASRAKSFYNASLLSAAPLVALSANAPILFGKRLWQETRIPLFEQAVDCGQDCLSRVLFGTGFASQSVLECFRENVDSFEILLPVLHEDNVRSLPHLRLHNGTIWRWIRPLLGFDTAGIPHVRLEQRVASAGPSTIDMAANMAFHLGLTQALSSDDQTLAIDFSQARANFYSAARWGWNGQVTWGDSWSGNVRQLIGDRLLPLAERGLQELKVDADIVSRLLGVIGSRVESGQHGAAWQIAFYEQCGRDASLLVREYRARQQAGEPVHTWSL